MKARDPRGHGVACGLVVLVALGAALPAQTDPRFENFRMLNNKETAFKFNAQAGQVFRVDASTNLTSWFSMASFPVPSGGWQHTNSAAPFHSNLFYHARQLTNTPTLTGDHLPTASGDVVIRPIRHASLALGWGNKTIYVDPANNAGLYAGLPRADLILFTHEHGDHFNASAIPGLTNTGVRICSSLKVYSQLSTGLRSLTTPLTNGQSADFGGILVEAVPAYNHANSPHSKGTNNSGYILIIGGRRLYIAGDTQDTAEMRALTNIDVAFLPVNQPYTMTVSQAVGAANAFRPKIAYPYHYQNADSTYADVTGFKQQVSSNRVTEVRLRKWY